MVYFPGKIQCLDILVGKKSNDMTDCLTFWLFGNQLLWGGEREPDHMAYEHFVIDVRGRNVTDCCGVQC